MSQSEILRGPKRRPRRGWQVLVHHDPHGGRRTTTRMGDPYRWRWVARRFGHGYRRHGSGLANVDVTVEIVWVDER